jgi:hypothetical protein
MYATAKELYSRYKILHTLNLGCSFITLKKQCKNQLSRSDIAWLHVTNHLYHSSLMDVNEDERLVMGISNIFKIDDRYINIDR